LIPGAHPLKHRAPVHFHEGTSEIEAEARLISSLTPVRPGTRAHVRFLLREPLLILPGDRFIVRMFSPVVTIGGGVVLDIAVPHSGQPSRMRRSQHAARLGKLENAAPQERIALLVSESKFGMSAAQLIARTGLLRSEIGSATWFTDPLWETQKIAALRAILVQYHRTHPLQSGLVKEELRSRELTGAPAHLLDDLLSHTKDIVAEGDLVRLASHRVALKHDEDEAVAKIEEVFRQAGLGVPSTSDVLAKCGVEIARARTLLQILMRNRKLVRVSDDLIFHCSALDQLRGLLGSRKGSRFSVAEFKDWTGVSRKYAIPLLEFLDRERITRREGDSRIIL
jgi:selenocysteine-specific elongation factor